MGGGGRGAAVLGAGGGRPQNNTSQRFWQLLLLHPLRSPRAPAQPGGCMRVPVSCVFNMVREYLPHKFLKADLQTLTALQAGSAATRSPPHGAASSVELSRGWGWCHPPALTCSIPRDSEVPRVAGSHPDGAQAAPEDPTQLSSSRTSNRRPRDAAVTSVPVAFRVAGYLHSSEPVQLRDTSPRSQALEKK